MSFGENPFLGIGADRPGGVLTNWTLFCVGLPWINRGYIVLLKFWSDPPAIDLPAIWVAFCGLQFGRWQRRNSEFRPYHCSNDIPRAHCTGPSDTSTTHPISTSDETSLMTRTPVYSLTPPFNWYNIGRILLETRYLSFFGGAEKILYDGKRNGVVMPRLTHDDSLGSLVVYPELGW